MRDLCRIHTYHMKDNPNYRDIIVTRNMIAKELGIATPKSPGGKLWSPKAYQWLRQEGITTWHGNKESLRKSSIKPLEVPVSGCIELQFLSWRELRRCS
ncbi:unnamed protein product [Chrysoparadoxa australica]